MNFWVQLTYDPAAMNDDNVYIHFPFCQQAETKANSEAKPLRNTATIPPILG